MATTSTTPLSGKRALVTGGSRGIGAEIVRRLAADGAAVAFTYNSSPEPAEALAAELDATGATVVAIQADSADADAVNAAVDETVSRLGGIDILVNNAGIATAGPIEEFPLEEFDRLIAVNVRAVFAAIQRAIPHLDGGGRIITIGSVNADRAPMAGLSVYALTKAAVAGLTRGLVRELGPRGITVNTIQPGPVATDMNPEEGGFSDQVRPFIAVGRYGQPSDIASAVAYLAAPEASYVTGVTWNIDGGFVI
ncbi:3-oxoacyl-ACP reductase family protein [Mycolicibacterium sp. 120266]|uniref:3-oxoacyl-ACP reductase family protein n=1 Tax=Mycolicibacterium sp. 120266 TaxID=3090601 RepID=UPI00299EA5BF|nr:3-oxoacyl-ACP reductase family protein [Mycolicibacterium sp. 120266]MDX1874965.1 3-oxoacyl-ACP reductase family protein [Mycolicibacterium sp. 120266]